MHVPDDAPLPYPPIVDNTCGVSAFKDLFFPPADLLVDVGGGGHDTNKEYVERNTPVKRMLILDPFCRSEAHNLSVLDEVRSKGGADIVTSMSVLNVLPEERNVHEHIKLVHYILKPGKRAYFKVWAGRWPDRGTGREVLDEFRESFQANKWASEFITDVEAVFGQKSCVCDVSLNLIVAVKPADEI
jgi:hypothetical protein